MLKKYIAITSVLALIAVIVLAFLYLHKYQQFTNNSPIHAVPVDAAIILQINNPQQLKRNLTRSNSFLNDLTPFESYRFVKNIINFTDSSEIITNSVLDDYLSRTFILSIHTLSDDASTGWLINAPIKSRAELTEINRLISSRNLVKANESHKGSRYFHILNKDHIPDSIYASVNNGYLTLSGSRELIEKSISQVQSGNSLLDNPQFSRIQKTSLTSNIASCYINFKTLPGITSQLFSAPALEHFSGWSELNMDIRTDAIYLNGFSFGDEPGHFTKLFRGVEPGKSEIANVLPGTTRFLTSYNFKSKGRFKENLIEFISNQPTSDNYERKNAGFKTRNRDSFEELFFSFIMNEAAYILSDPDINNNYSSFLVFNTTGQVNAMQALRALMTNSGMDPEKHREIILDDQTRFQVYDTPEKDIIKEFWGHFFPDVPANYFTFYRNYLIFGESSESISRFIYSNILNKTLSTHPYYSPFTESFSYQENFFLFAEVPHIFKMAESHFNRSVINPTREQTQALENFYGLGIQLSSANDLIYTSVHGNYAPHRDKEPRTIWQSRLDSTIIGKPALVDNHNTGEKEILVQDAHYNLYLINNLGRVLWKRPLDGPIMGDVIQIDYYKNNKLQYLFNTPNRLWLLDRNGNHVARFPVNFPSKATNPIAVFDYDNNKEYRIFVALEDQRVYLYDKTGNRVPGWSVPSTEGMVSAPIQYFRNLGRDYIVFSDQFRNYILDRRGDNRVTPSANFIRNSGSPFYLERENSNRAALVTTTITGELAKIALPSGNTTLETLIESPGSHHFTLLSANSANPEYLYTTINQLIVFNQSGRKAMEVNFENQIHPHADLYRFTATDIKFGVVEQTGGHIHLINRDGSHYQGFPLRGISRFSIGFLRSSAYRFNLITGGEHNYLYNYRVE
ncbi:DUF3352 domain-containing protein [Natronoflexus pectinivorans]|uniref:Uncharacterized protein DUF3352 n=1 Tax=Natronoflexus pectinivorans TaxID=682526 RepID=A0A4R2GPB9_9BACT|nr:DUF3352 domain-containing protein [Natronoflexus pectinivorans]TCO10917.1 uncharacterized protein DUF3352 [Natronoflexus pectinivorans]